MQRPSTERFNRYNYFDFSAKNPLSQQTGLDLRGGLVFVNSSDRFQTAPDNADLAPRVGISYKLHNRIVARMGYGIFYLMGFGTATQGGPAAGTDGFSVATNWVNTRGGDGITPQDLLSNLSQRLEQSRRKFARPAHADRFGDHRLPALPPDWLCAELLVRSAVRVEPIERPRSRLLG
ncbi:MAG: hypothetical protein U0Q16_04710 [Bryobacteraceae bacterium]